MSRSRLIDKWESDLRGLSDDQVRERQQLARKNAAESLQSGMGRSPKACRMWRRKAEQADAELERRGLRP
jgi:hypothetical protein